MKQQNQYDRDALEFEAKILTKLSAYEIMQELGFDEAVIMFPELKNFLNKVQEMPYAKVRHILLNKLDTSFHL